ncbi:MAG TPA: hypothetical protein VGK37_01900 [Casimicrobiaceae bacterium]|jgi:hypothetical protein
MEKGAGTRAGNGDGGNQWVPNPRWVHVEPDASGIGARHIRHPRYPYPYPAPAMVDEGLGQAALEKALFALASEYLQSANELLKLPPGWLPSPGSMLPPDPLGVAWLPFDEVLRGSFWVTRYEDPMKRTGVIDRAAVLLGTLAFVPESGKPHLLRGGQGLQVIAQFGAPVRGQIPIRVTGASHTLPRLDAAADPKAMEVMHATLGRGLERSSDTSFRILSEFMKQMPSLFGLPPQSVPIESGIRILPGAEAHAWDIEIVSKTAQVRDSAAIAPDRGWMPETSYLVAARVLDPRTFEPVAKLALVAHATANVLPSDPVTAGGPRIFSATRPHRPSAAFATYLDAVTLWNPTPAAPGRVLLEDTGGFIRVLRSALTDDPLPYSQTKEVADNVTAEARSNEFAAVNAYVRASEFVLRLLACGFAPKTTLRYLTFPLAVQYRGGIHPGATGGKTVNAQVRWLSPPTDVAGSAWPGTAEVSFALADLRLNPAYAPLGIAADARWAWHEWSHVMLAGATGSLEFEFAHSAGDALAAIVSDPDSALATHPKWRGRTFPWVTLPDRCHTRDVKDGWGWAGTLFQRERYFAAARNVCDKQPYWSEQIQSSSLFQMYRSLGGDTMTAASGSSHPDRDIRRAVSDYSIYLIVRAIATMGSASTHPVPTADGFVSQLIAADTGTATFATPGRLFIGGAAGKVIRWAYQQQGLYADPALPYPVDAPGLPADVDIYIEDHAGRHGGYEALRYLDHDWQASPSGMRIVRLQNDPNSVVKPKAGAKVFLLVFVNNCGRANSDNVTVRSWVAQMNSAGQIPGWHGAGWQPLNLVAGPVSLVAPPDSAGGGPAGPWIFEWTPAAAGKRYALMAEATCMDDPSNIDPTTGLPCATVATGGADASDIAYLVSCDNNLGLIEAHT